MYLKIHKSVRNVVALCDNELLGKKFEEGNRQLDVRENFYKGDHLSEDEVADVMKYEAYEDSTFNIVGSKSIQIAKDLGIINDEDVSIVSNVPFVLLLL